MDLSRNKIESVNMSPTKIESRLQQDFKANNCIINVPVSPYGFRTGNEGIIRPKPMHVTNQNLAGKDTKSSDVKDEETKSGRAESREPRKDEKYAYIDSVYPGADKVRVLRSHLGRIMKRRKAKKITSNNSEFIVIPRAKTEGPIHDSRSKFAKKRPRDRNGRFYTKEELEQMRQAHMINSIAEYLQQNAIPGFDPE